MTGSRPRRQWSTSRLTLFTRPWRGGWPYRRVQRRHRSAERVASELRKLLTRLDVPRPYVLVGLSLGGLNAQVYAALYPEGLAGVVLLDAPPMSFILREEYGELSEMANSMTDQWQAAADAGLDSEDPDERGRPTSSSKR
ncbi:MAG: alpha/beta fold hydrolase [Candidatus Eisenbacteria bacterium]|nr:alpha/beta fold hydrolase [Candidatus Eisenbacteria bacterium]